MVACEDARTTGTSQRSLPTLAKPTLAKPMAKPTLASVCVLVVCPTLAKTDFGKSEFDLWCCVWCVAWVLVSRFHGVGFHVWVLVSRFWFGHVRCPRDHFPGPRPSRDRALPGTAPFPAPRPSRDRALPGTALPRTALPRSALPRTALPLDRPKFLNRSCTTRDWILQASGTRT